MNEDTGRPLQRLTKEQMLHMGPKVVTVLSLIALGMNVGDKTLVFSQSLPALDLIERMLESKQWGDMVNVDPDKEHVEKKGLRFSSWKPGINYLRIDGTYVKRKRKRRCDRENVDM